MVLAADGIISLDGIMAMEDVTHLFGDGFVSLAATCLEDSHGKNRK